jgi:hypothetical protein
MDTGGGRTKEIETSVDRSNSTEQEAQSHAEKPTSIETGTVIDETMEGLQEPEPPKNLQQHFPLLVSVSDRRFFNALRFLQAVRRTILYEHVEVSPEDEELLDLAHLNLLRSPSQSDVEKRKYRLLTLGEWHEIDSKTRILIRYLSDHQIRKLQLNHISGMLLFIPAWLLIVSMASLLASIALSGSQDYKVLFIACFISWLATMGGLGSAAFIYVNALSIQVDPTVDVISLPLVMMRVVLGALFAVILALPFGYQSFQKFGQNLFVPNSTVDLSEGLLLLLPFILGFSTPLVLSILNRFVQSAQTFFGVREQSEATTQGSARVSADGKRGANRDAGSARGGGCHLAHRRFDRTSVTGSSNVSGAGCECRVSTPSRHRRRYEDFIRQYRDRLT